MSNRVEMTKGPLGKKILKYALVIAATGILQQLFNAADIAVIGQFCGTNAQAAVGSNSPVIGLLVNLFVGISLGSNVVIARAVGERDEKSVSNAVHTSMIIAAAGGVLMLILGEIFAESVVAALGVPDGVYEMSVKYLKIYFLGMPVILLYNFEAAIFRSVGNTKTPLLALLCSGIANVGLNLFFVLALGMDVDGVALATVISNFISSAILFVCLLKAEGAIKLRPKDLKIDGRILARIMKIGVPSGVQSMIFSFANIMIQSSINSLGPVVMAGSASAFNLEIIAYYVINSFGQACATFVGQNFGAGKSRRCLKTLKICLLQCVCSAVIICGLILLLSRQLLAIFNSDSEVIAAGHTRLCFIFAAYTFSFVQEVMSGYLRGYGVSIIPALCSIIGICGVRLCWIFTVFKMYPTFDVIMMVYPISLAITAISILLTTLIVKPSKKYFKRWEDKDE